MGSRYDLPLTYTDGIVHGFVEIIKAPKAPLIDAAHQQAMAVYLGENATRYSTDSYRKVILQATTNGKVWSWALRPHHSVTPGKLHWISQRSYIPIATAKMQAHRNRTSLENPYRDLVAWAIKDMAKRSKLPAGDPGALQLDVAYEREAPAEVGIKLPGPCGPITYTGYQRTVGRFTIEDVHDIVVSAVTACLPHWNWQGGRGPWRPSHLEVMLHQGKRAFGLAYAPGTGAERNHRTISLNETILKLYDEKSIWRVVVHELCHHYRDEVFSPRDTDLPTSERLRAAMSAALARVSSTPGADVRAHQQLMQRTLQTHDSVFVRELAKVDDKVSADPYAGIVFTEYADSSLVADAQAQKEARQAKRLSSVDWSPTAGRLWVNRLKGGHFAIYWVSLAEGGFKVKLGMLAPGVLEQLIAKMGAAAGGEKDPQMPARVLGAAVTYSETWPLAARPDTILSFVQMCESQFKINALRSTP